jgi:hypothetical protein
LRRKALMQPRILAGGSAPRQGGLRISLYDGGRREFSEIRGNLFSGLTALAFSRLVRCIPGPPEPL